MFEINEDKTINITRGDIGAFTVDVLNEAGEKYLFQKGDVVRIKVTEKKACENVMFQKDFVVEEETEQVEILLTEEETKIGEVISKPTDYWYEIELNPLTNPQTIIGYDEDGAKIFKLFPEGNDIEPVEPTPEDIPVVDEELDLTSERPVQNHVIARAILTMQEEIARIDTDVNITSEDLEPLQGAIEANKTNIAKNTGNIEDLTNNVEELNAHTANTSNPHNVTAEQTHFDKNISGMSANNVQGAIDELSEYIGLCKTNHLPNTLSTQTINGVTLTKNNDGSVTLNGTSTTDLNFVIGTTTLDVGNYILNGCPKNGSTGTYCMYASVNSVNFVDKGDGVNIPITTKVTFNTRIVILKGQTLNNLTFYPMISKEGGEYKPYVEDVKTYIDDRYSHNTNNITFPFTAPHSGILNLCLTIGSGTAGVVGNMIQIKSPNGFIRNHYCIGYANGWGAVTFPVPLAKGDIVTLSDKFSGTYNAVYSEMTYFTY